MLKWERASISIGKLHKKQGENKMALRNAEEMKKLTEQSIQEKREDYIKVTLDEIDKHIEHNSSEGYYNASMAINRDDHEQIIQHLKELGYKANAVYHMIGENAIQQVWLSISWH